VGNTNGVFLAAGVQGNTIRGNVITGNPPVQVAIDHSSNTGYDIKNMAAADANTFDGNLCVTGLNAPCPLVPPIENSSLAAALEASVCGVRLRSPLCRAPVSAWNDHLVHEIRVGAKPLMTGDRIQLMTAGEYVQARAAAGIERNVEENRR
jgi:hypothetical protein